MRFNPFVTCVIILFVYGSNPAFGQGSPQPPASSAKKKSLDVTQQMEIKYGSTKWNKDSSQIDGGFLILKDKNSGKIVQIQLEETEPDSSEFRGQFSVSIGDTDKIAPEIFIPGQEIKGKADYKKIIDEIQSGAMNRQPIIVIKNERGQSAVDVYDTREQAQAALQAYRDQQKAAEEIKKRALIKAIPTEATLEAARQAEYRAKMDKLALEAAKREAERVRLEQIERQKAEERARQEKLVSEHERAERKARAANLAAEAMELYNQGNYLEAEKKFHESVNLDPENKAYYFKYGVTLYRNQKYNDALVTLKLAKTEGQEEFERKFYMGLAHYRLGELDLALKNFNEVAASKNKAMAPSAQFYAGVIYFAQEKFPAAKKAFETVIDTSNDPRMDDQAEEYIDRIASAQMYQKLREHKFSVTGTLGLMYDSNVMLAPDNAADQGLPTNVSDLRLLTIGELNYRPVFNEHHEWSINLNAGLTNSKENLSAPADPYIYNLSVPYSYKGVVWSKGYRLTVKPAHEILYMDPTGTGTKSLQLTSNLVTVDNTFVINKSLFSTYTLEYRHDDSSTPTSVGVNSLTANKFSIRTIQSYFLDKSHKEAVMGNLGFVNNAALGSNMKYTRYELGATYVRPVFWGYSWNVGLNYYQLHYPFAVPSRDDKDIAFATGLSKPIREWVTWGLQGSYVKNNSTNSLYKYTKYTVLTTATFNSVF